MQRRSIGAGGQWDAQVITGCVFSKKLASGERNGDRVSSSNDAGDARWGIEPIGPFPAHRLVGHSMEGEASENWSGAVPERAALSSFSSPKPGAQ